ncbi:hypothetical protein IHMA87_00866 [Pseudomonas paraeruginosa]|nr:hypothetical protein IHMA87_00866 [Pseudomonas aeruginosa]VFT22245.1 putative lipoprotein [Pseudomonas aeruginosa]
MVAHPRPAEHPQNRAAPARWERREESDVAAHAKRDKNHTLRYTSAAPDSTAMEQPMTLRPIALLAFLLLAACSSDKPKPAPTPPAPRSVSMVEPVLPAHLRELSGTLSSVQGSLPRGSEVQMALLVIDERDRPQRLLASETVLASGELMPFRLPFNPESFPPAGGALRVELHARVIQSGQLAWRLHPLRIAQPTTQALGELRLVRAP